MRGGMFVRASVPSPGRLAFRKSPLRGFFSRVFLSSGMQVRYIGFSNIRIIRVFINNKVR